MSRFKTVAAYPLEYQELVRKAALGEAGIELKVPSRMMAVKWRGHFYAFVGALRREKTVLEAQKRPLTPAEKDMIDVAMLSQRVLVQVGGNEENGTVILCNRDKSWQAEVARQAVTITAGPLAVNSSVSAPPLPEGVVICPVCKQFPCGCHG